MADHPSSHWALKITATAGSDLNLAEKLALEAYRAAALFEVGVVVRVSHIEILNRETGQRGSYIFAGVGAGIGAGVVSADVADKWHPFDTKRPVTIEEFGKHSATLYNASAGLGFNWAPISGIRFGNIGIQHNSVWESLWNENGISVGGITSVNAGTSLDISEAVGKIFKIHPEEEGNQNVIRHLDEINQICAANGLETYSYSASAEDSRKKENSPQNLSSRLPANVIQSSGQGPGVPYTPKRNLQQKQSSELSFVLETRSFIPDDSFGGFDGDHRGFSLSSDASSRIHSKIILRPDTASYSDPDVWSDKSRAAEVPLLKGREGYSASRMDPIRITPLEKGAEYQLHSFGSNPLLPAPDSDLHTKVSITHPLPRIVNIEVELRGDQFPAFEVVLRDKSGTPLFLGGFMSPSSAGALNVIRETDRLRGDPQRPMGKLNIQVVLDAHNNFDRIISVKFSGPYSAIGKTVSNQTFSPAGWSRALMTALTPDHMPRPQLPPLGLTPTLKQQLAPQKSKQIVPVNLKQGPEKSKQPAREKSKHGTDKSKQVSSETRGTSKEKSPQEKAMEKPVVIKGGPGMGD